MDFEGDGGLDGQEEGRKTWMPGRGRAAVGIGGPAEWPPGGRRQEKQVRTDLDVEELWLLMEDEVGSKVVQTTQASSWSNRPGALSKMRRGFRVGGSLRAAILWLCRHHCPSPAHASAPSPQGLDSPALGQAPLLPQYRAHIPRL